MFVSHRCFGAGGVGLKLALLRALVRKKKGQVFGPVPSSVS
jgi:hypothetical protein